MTSQKVYEKRYKDGYGTMYPDGHIIRFYEKFLKYELGIDGKGNENILDFGCGNGTHPVYFGSKGFNVCGLDVADTAIKITQERLPELKENFITINPGEKIDELFNMKFDIIISNQTLYYLSNAELASILNQFDGILNEDGLVYFTMMGDKNFFRGNAADMSDDGLREVTLSGRLSHSIKINFTKDEDDLKNKFSIFDPYFVGFYDITMREGSGFHYQFIGKKKK